MSAIRVKHFFSFLLNSSPFIGFAVKLSHLGSHLRAFDFGLLVRQSVCIQICTGLRV